MFKHVTVAFIIMFFNVGIAVPHFSLRKLTSSFWWFWSDDWNDDTLSVTTTTPSPISFPERCGNRIGNRIVGGVDGEDWPWAVSLLTSRGQHFCGGSIITKRHILTAAHCAYKFRKVPALLIGFGGHRLDNHRRESVSKVFIHEDYKHGYRFDADIAILKLDKEIEFDIKASPVCLPKSNQEHKEGGEVHVKGWGRLNETLKKLPNHLQSVSLNMLSSNTCKQVYGRMFDETMLCVGDNVPDKDACQGDSGGPLVLEHQETKRWTQVGVVSFGMGCGRVGFPGVYTKLADYVNWIEEKIHQ